MSSEMPSSPSDSQPPKPAWKQLLPQNKWQRIGAAVLAFALICYIISLCFDDDSHSGRHRDYDNNNHSDGRHGGDGEDEHRSDDLSPAISLDETLQTASARGALQASLTKWNQQFGGTLQLAGAMGSNDDRQAEALLSVMQNGRRMFAVAKVASDGARCRVVAEFVPADRLVAMQSGPNSAGQSAQAAAEPLSQRSLPDGSGTISLPSGWQIAEADQGSVVAMGNNGAFVELSVRTQFYTEGAMGMSAPIMYPYGPAAQIFPGATQTLWNFLQQNVGGPARQFGQIVESAAMPCESPNQQAMLVVYDSTMNGQAYRSLAFFFCQPTSPTSWLYYLSSVSSPRDNFAKNLPTLRAIWRSWQVDPAVTQKRLDDAAAKLRSCADIIGEVSANRQRAFDRANEGWTEYIRGQTFVRDSQTGETREVPYYDLEKIVQRRNEMEGGQRFQIIPRSEVMR